MQKMKINIFELGYILILISFIYGISRLSELFGNIKYILEGMGVLLLLFKIGMNKYKQKQFLGILAIGAILLITTIQTRNEMYLITFIMVLAAKKVDLECLIRLDLWIRVPMVLLIVLLGRFGVITDRLEYRTGSVVRHSYGFTHPNNFGAMLMVVAMYWFYLRHRRFKIWDYIGIGSLAILCDVISNSRTASYAIVTILLVEIIDALISRSQYLNKKKEFWLKVFGVFIIVIPAISIYFAVSYQRFNVFHAGLNELLNGRLYLSNIALNNNGIRLLGQYVEVTPWSIAKNVYETNAIDNAYVFTLVHFGYLTFMLVMIAIYQIYRHSIQTDDHKLSLCLLFTLMIGFIEHQIYNVGENIFLLTLTSAIFGISMQCRARQQSPSHYETQLRYKS